MAFLPFFTLLDPESIVVAGGVVSAGGAGPPPGRSTVKLRLAGVASALPDGSFART